MLMLMSMAVFIMSVWLMYKNKVMIIEWEMLNLGTSYLTLPLIIDIKGCLFSSVVLFISSNVLMFSKTYMKEDKFINRFTNIVLLFILSMNLLIYIPSMVILLLGWDGLGIVSFILVIYYQNSKSLAAGMLTAMTNRIGDVMILMAIVLTLNQGHWNILDMSFMMQVSKFQILMIMTAAMTKSAQMPFSSWLPAAMAAPTPVSALVHSSTLVTAGVFLLLRFYPFLHKLEMFNTILLYLAMMTMIMSGMCACVEWDMKKIIALSTLSQLGLMMVSLGLNLPSLTFFHMVVHAMFKALLFICAGILINNYMHSQDLRWMGNIIYYMPMTTSCSLLANLAMSGFPFMAAFYSKDSIIEMSMFMLNSATVLILLYISVGVTSFYGIRFIMSILCNNYMGPVFYSPQEPNNITTPMMMLAIPSITSGLMMWWLLPTIDIMLLMKPNMMLTPLMIMFVGMFLSWLWNDQALDVEYPTLHMSSNMWYITPMSTQIPMNKYFKLSKNYLEDIDHSWMEMYSGMGLHKLLTFKMNNVLSLIKYNPTSLLVTSSTLSITILMILM
uniref:NADH-ubiquinone oxidoreductase chain 5 n=1 Tax=Erpobdella testacea TaxID=92797 RepID=A0A7D6W5K1_9ANNE|nr:NADH dehydrogenase subunit 5 [Erpobdella testacea]